MTGPRLRRLLALIVLGAVVLRAVRGLRGNPTRAFDRSTAPVRSRPEPGRSPTTVAPVETEPSSTKLATAAPAPAPAIDTSEATASPAWVAPVEGVCPDGYPVKAKLRSGIFHLPGMSAYVRTTPDRCYRNGDAAVADGLRVAKR